MKRMICVYNTNSESPSLGDLAYFKCMGDPDQYGDCVVSHPRFDPFKEHLWVGKVICGYFIMPFGSESIIFKISDGHVDINKELLALTMRGII